MTPESRRLDYAETVGRLVAHITTLNIEPFDFNTPKEEHLYKEVFVVKSVSQSTLIITIRDPMISSFT